MAIELQQVRHFLAVCEHLNFTRAAEQCAITQPALTRSIQKLEGQLRGRLFMRERRQTHLTDLARLVLPNMRNLLNEARAAQLAATAFLKSERTKVKIGILPTIGPLRIARCLQHFTQANPDIEPWVDNDRIDELLQQLTDGQIDIALVSSVPAVNGQLQVEHLYEERYVAVFPAGHRFEQSSGLSLAEVMAESYLDRLACEFRATLMKAAAERGIEPRCRYRSEHDDWVQGMVAAGLGVTVMPEHSITAPGLATRPLTDPPLTRKVLLATMGGRRSAPGVQLLIRELLAFRWDR